MPQSRQLVAIMFTDIVGYTALMVRPGSVVQLGDSNVYYCTQLDEGVNVSLGGSGRLIQAQCDPSIPTVSQWGVMVMALLILSCGTLVCRRRMIRS